MLAASVDPAFQIFDSGVTHHCLLESYHSTGAVPENWPPIQGWQNPVDPAQLDVTSTLEQLDFEHVYHCRCHPHHRPSRLRVHVASLVIANQSTRLWTGFAFCGASFQGTCKPGIYVRSAYKV
jgi:hypothetical protein